LKPIPLTDPYSLVRPVDPFDAFSQLRGIGLLEPYDEIPETTNDARLYLKNVMGSFRGKPKSEKVVWKNDCAPFATLKMMSDPLHRRQLGSAL
jgi:hypothetical protein